MISAHQIGLKEVIRGAVLAREDGGFSRALNKKIERTGGKLQGLTDVTKMKMNAESREARDIEFRPFSVEVVHADDVRVW
jgi:hypothetical protein